MLVFSGKTGANHYINSEASKPPLCEPVNKVSPNLRYETHEKDTIIFSGILRF